MDPKDRIRNEFDALCGQFNQLPSVARTISGEIDALHYQWLMRQIFHHARENPQIQALATVYFRGTQRDMVKPFFQHATSEIGHDKLALNDLEAMGVDTSGIPNERPLPATTALVAYPFYQICQRNPVGYIGYLVFLEYLPTSMGTEYMTAFIKAGVPEKAMSFLTDHVTIDQYHIKQIARYIDELLQDEEDIQSAIHALRVTGGLYGQMVEQAFERADAVLVAAAA